MRENRIQKRVEGAAVHQAGGFILGTRRQKVTMLCQEWTGGAGKPKVFPPPGSHDEVTGKAILSV